MTTQLNKMFIARCRFVQHVRLYNKRKNCNLQNHVINVYLPIIAFWEVKGIKKVSGNEIHLQI